MTDFPIFFNSLLSSVAAFLWADSVRWITAAALLLMLITAIKRIIRF